MTNFQYESLEKEIQIKVFNPCIKNGYLTVGRITDIDSDDPLLTLLLPVTLDRLQEILTDLDENFILHRWCLKT